MLLFTLFTVTRFAMHRNCILCSFALAAPGILAHSARKHLAEQCYVNRNLFVAAAGPFLLVWEKFFSSIRSV